MGAAWRVRGFELDRRLGAGASSEVWRARVTSSGDVVALKRLVLPGVEQGRRAVAEAAKLRVLDHPHLVRLHDLVLHRDGAVLVLDLADAGSLADLLTVRGRITPGEAITAIAPVAAALAHVHAAGVVHGDVSPANILFARGGLPLLADLGVARLTGDDADAQSTPAYVDPLVARGGVPTSHSDVFMLGAVALHALTGAPLWTAPTGDAALAQAATGGLGHVEGRLAMADLPPGTSAVIRRALSLEPHRRGTAADFALDLRHSGEPVAVELAAGRTRVVGAASGTPAAGEPRTPKSRAVAAGPADPRSQSPVPAPASLTRPRRLPGGLSGDPSGGPPVAVPAASPSVAATPPASAPATPAEPAARQAPPRGGGGRHAAVPVTRRRRDETEPSAVDRVRRAIAGRGRVPAAEPADARPPIPSTAGDPARPPFTRPTSTGPVGSIPDLEVVVGRPAPTRAVARARPGLPTARRRTPVRALVTGAGVVVALATVVLATVLVGREHVPAVAAPAGVVRGPSSPVPSRSVPQAGASPTHMGPAGSSPTGPSPTSVRPTGVRPTGVRPTDARPTDARPTDARPTDARPTDARPTDARATDTAAPAVLRRLDTLRTQAYATRNAALLRRVYAAGPLRAADSASLARLVPPGCGLYGLQTRFRAVTTRREGDETVVLTRASLPATHLVCSGRVVRTARAVGPTRLAITLVERGGAVLIADERALS